MVLINGDTEDESDDIVSESKLYDYFCKAVKEMDNRMLNDETISNVINDVLINEDNPNKSKIVYALKVMVYGFISGNCIKQIKANLEELKK